MPATSTRRPLPIWRVRLLLLSRFTVGARLRLTFDNGDTQEFVRSQRVAQSMYPGWLTFLEGSWAAIEGGVMRPHFLTEEWVKERVVRVEFLPHCAELARQRREGLPLTDAETDLVISWRNRRNSINNLP